jgi:hypothetical protein
MLVERPTGTGDTIRWGGTEVRFVLRVSKDGSPAPAGALFSALEKKD